MSPKPTGHVSGNDLILTRTFHAPIADVWTSVTKSESTALWFGRWEGEAGPGKTVRLQLLHEKSQPWTDVLIEECAAPHRLVVVMKDDAGEWRIALTFTQTGGHDGAAPGSTSERPETRRRRRAGLGILPRYAGRRARRQGFAVIFRLLSGAESALSGRRLAPGGRQSDGRVRHNLRALPLWAARSCVVTRGRAAAGLSGRLAPSQPHLLAVRHRAEPRCATPER